MSPTIFSKDTLFAQTLKRILWRSWILTKLHNRINGRNPLKEPQGRIWIGGFPRSGNTFAATFIDYLTTCDPLEKHLHSPAQILRFVRSGDRGLVVFREPLGACVSLSIYSGIEIARALKNYIDFHNILINSNIKICWVDFEIFHQNPLLLIKLLDLKDKCEEGKLAKFKSEPEVTLKKIFDKIDEGWIENPNQTFEKKTARPMAIRENMKQDMKKMVLGSAYLTQQLDLAKSIFEKIKLREAKEAPHWNKI